MELKYNIFLLFYHSHFLSDLQLMEGSGDDEAHLKCQHLTVGGRMVGWPEPHNKSLSQKEKERGEKREVGRDRRGRRVETIESKKKTIYWLV